jgi:hypothetical protein
VRRAGWLLIAVGVVAALETAVSITSRQSLTAAVWTLIVSSLVILTLAVILDYRQT